MVAAIIGPLVLGVLDYRTSDTTLHQIVGGDLAALFVVAPVCVIVAVLSWRGHRAAAVLALAPAVFALYTYAQLIVGNEYLRLPGNVEAFFPLLLSIFVTAAAVAVTAWNSTPKGDLPIVSRRLESAAAWLLIAIAVFVVVGLHARSYVDALSGHPTSAQYVSSPTPFWLVKLMDLGIVVPAAVAVAIGLFRRQPWARKAMYAILGAYTLLACSVTGMAAVMWFTDDPDASGVTLVGTAGLTLALGGFVIHLYRPLFGRLATLTAAPRASAPREKVN